MFGPCKIPKRGNKPSETKRGHVNAGRPVFLVNIKTQKVTNKKQTGETKTDSNETPKDG